MQIVRRIFRNGIPYNPIKIQFNYIPKFKPKEEIKHQDFMLPKRPKMDPNDPTETYIIPQFPEAINESMNEFQTLRSEGTAYLSVEKNGKIFHLYDASRMVNYCWQGEFLFISYQPFGRMCQHIARHISGKTKPIYKTTEPQNIGDRCVVINATNIRLTGKKVKQKVLRYHTGYVGNLREIPFERLIKTKPEQLVRPNHFKYSVPYRQVGVFGKCSRKTVIE